MNDERPEIGDHDGLAYAYFAPEGEPDLFVVTADNTDEPERRGTIFRIDAGVGGAPVHPARV